MGRITFNEPAFLIIFFVLSFQSISTNAQVWEEWVATYNGRGNGPDYIEAIALDGQGNVCITGYTDRAYHPDYADWDYTTIKYNSAGELQWIAIYWSMIDGCEKAYDLEVDQQGNIYVTGEIQDNTYSRDYTTLKYDSMGNELWVARYEGPGVQSDNVPSDLAVDNSGNLYVTGTSYNSVTYEDFATVKYNSNGEEIWATRYNGPNGSCDKASSLAVDLEGNVYVNGQSINETWQYEIATIKYDPDGEELWGVFSDPPSTSEDLCGEMVLDENGNIYVVGVRCCYISQTDISCDLITMKYNNDGIEQWIATYPSCVWGYSQSPSIAVDPGGNVIVCGKSEDIGTGTDFVTVKYDPEGNEIWAVTCDGPGSDHDKPNDLVVDSAGDIYVTGEVTGGSPYYNLICATVKYNSEGVEQWVMLYDNEYTSGSVIATDGHGQVYVGGYCWGDTTERDYLLIRYSQPVGIEEQPVESHPAIFCLYSPFPNPFNLSTVFRYQLSAASLVNLSVYDITGRKVSSLVSDWRKAGKHEVIFDASDLAAGIYLYRIEAGNHVETGKIALLK